MISKNNWNVYCTRFLVRARQLTEPIAFTDPFGHEHVGRPGDYLVETSNGTRRIATRDFFEDVYLPLAAAIPGAAKDNFLSRRPPAGITRSDSRLSEERPALRFGREQICESKTSFSTGSGSEEIVILQFGTCSTLEPLHIAIFS